MNLMLWHMLLVFFWAVFMISLAKSIACRENSKILAVLSLIFMFSVLFVGTKLMLLFPQVAKSGMWIHVKLSIDIIEMLVNIYMAYVVFKKKEISSKKAQTLYWSTVLLFAAMYSLTLFKPF